MRGMGCALSIHQKERRKSLGCALYIGARYIPENTVLNFCAISGMCRWTGFGLRSGELRKHLGNNELDNL
jgi:hypothetical protein